MKNTTIVLSRSWKAEASLAKSMPRVEIAGRVDANVTGTTSVSIDSSAEVSGVIRFFKLAVSPGAVITGELVTMAEESYSPLAR